MQVLNKYKTSETDYVSIMRPSPLGNPFVIGEHGTRDEVIEMFDQWLTHKVLDEDLVVLGALRSLNTDSKLMCCCPENRCHGNVIVRIWEELMLVDSFEEGIARFKETRDKPLEYEPKNDGIDHLNIYSDSLTSLGKILSNFARTPFEHPEYGKFESIEGFWYWFGTGRKHEHLRRLYGYQAKKEGMKLKVVHVDGFDDKLIEAIEMKVRQHPLIEKELIESTLPFTHYYWYGTIDNCRVIKTKSGDWLVNVLTDLRTKLKSESANQSVSCKVIIAGSRDVTDLDIVRNAYKASGFIATEILSGGAKGVDTLGEKLASELGLPVKKFPADWETNGKSAGYLRNVQMSEYGDCLIAIRKNMSKGTTHMVDIMEKANKPTYVVDIDGDKQ